MARSDYAFPFRIDPASGQAAQSPYATHVDEMIRQVLLTTPGERADLPSFGCGLRQLLFTPNTSAPQVAPNTSAPQVAPNTSPLQATTQILVQQSLAKWLGNQIQVQNVTVSSGEGGDYSQLLVQIQYTLIETQSLQTTQILVA
jgi:uncharacterized protein